MPETKAKTLKLNAKEAAAVKEFMAHRGDAEVLPGLATAACKLLMFSDGTRLLSARQVTALELICACMSGDVIDGRNARSGRNAFAVALGKQLY